MVDENILIFGTSADPIHKGHEILVEECVRALRIDGIDIQEVLIMPVYRRNLVDTAEKNHLEQSYPLRLRLCELTAEALSKRFADIGVRTEASRMEETLGQDSRKPSYTSETLAALKDRYDTGARFFLLLGSDAFSGETPSFGQWYQMADILKRANLVICPRHGYPVNIDFLRQLKAQVANIIYLEEIQVPEISSREIKRRILSGENIMHLVDETILSKEAADYIEQSGLIKSWKSLDESNEDEILRKDCRENLEQEIGRILTKKGSTLALAESCTGGFIGHRITNVPGSSVYFFGGVVAYAYEAKVKLLGVRWDTLQAYGAVSRETVIEMARGARQALDANIGLSVCCIAGPGGATPTKPVGTGWIGLSTPEGDWAKNTLFEFDRVRNKEAIAEAALRMLLDYLRGNAI